MARSKALEYYPEVYRDLLRKAMTESHTLLVPFETVKQAVKFRGSFYAYLGAVKARAKEINLMKGSGVEPGQVEQEILGDALFAERCMIELRHVGPGEKCKLAFLPREHSWQAKKIMEVEQGEAHGGGPRITDGGQVVDANELGMVEMYIFQFENLKPMGQENALAQIRQNAPELLQRHPKLAEAVRLWEGRRNLGAPDDEMSQRISDRLASYGVKPTGGGQ